MNFASLMMVMRGIHKHDKSSVRKSTAYQRQSIIKEARRAFSCSVLLGTTYVFGVLAIKDVKLLFQTVFCIFNSLQGFFIFVFYVAMNEDVLKEWKSLCLSGSSISTPKLSTGKLNFLLMSLVEVSVSFLFF